MDGRLKPTQFSDVRGFINWLSENNIRPSNDYDHMGAYNAGVQPDDRGHFPDTYKLPNHITYSDESVYSQKSGAPPPGKWTQNEDRSWDFYASPTNIKNAGGVANLQQYFKDNEPHSRLILPNGK